MPDGPPIRMFWKGSPGGERNPTTVESNDDYKVVLDLLLERPSVSSLTAVFCTDDIQAWRVRKRGIPDDGFEETGRAASGNQAPGLDTRTELHAEIILELKDIYECKGHTGKRRSQPHTGDHRATAFCWVLDSGEHLELTHSHFKVWAAAIAAGNTGVDKPPKHPLFEDPGQLANPLDAFTASGPKRTSVRRSGATGNPTMETAYASAAGSMAALAGMMGMYNLAPNMLALVNQHMGTPPHSSSLPPPSQPPSPVPEPGMELEACIAAFLKKVGVNLTDKVETLRGRGLGPDIIHAVPYEHLAQTLDVLEGDALRFQEFTKKWHSELKFKQSK